MPLPEKSTRYLKIKKYYINNIPNCIVLFIVYWVVWWREIGNGYYFIYLFIMLISLSLFPMAKLLIESIALKYTTREFWNRGFFLDSPGRMSIIMVYDWICFAVAIPLGVICIIYFRMKKE